MHEFDDERWERLGITFNVLSETENGIWVNFNKKGNLSWSRAQFFEHPSTWLKTCDLCGRTSTGKHVQVRNDCFRTEWLTPTLCTGCWNKVRRVVRLYEELTELRKLTNKLRRIRRSE